METIVNIYFFKFVQKINEDFFEILLFKLVFYCFTIQKNDENGLAMYFFPFSWNITTGNIHDPTPIPTILVKLSSTHFHTL